MSKSIYNVSLLDIMPQSLLSDPFVVAMARSIDPELQGISAEIIKCILLPRIDELPGEVVDVLAWQFHADFYRPNLPIAIKRQILKNSLKWQRTKGTPAVVEDLLITIFEDRVRLVEWFDYNASPYFFKVVADNSPSFTEVANFFKLIATVKNSRSWLDKVHVINDGLFLIPKNKRIYFEHETGAVYSGQWVFAKSTGLVCFKVIEAGAVSLAGTYTFPYIGVSTGIVFRPVVYVETLPTTGSWPYPRANIKCGISPEIQTIGQAKSTWVKASAEKYAGTYTFPHIGVSTGLVFRPVVAIVTLPITGSWLYPRANIKCGISPEIQTIGQAKSTWARVSAEKYAGTYTFPHIGVSTGVTTELTAAVSPYPVSGSWLYPRASIRCGVSPEAQVIGQLASTQIAADTKAMAGIYVFPCAGVSSGIPVMKGAKNTIHVTAGTNDYIRCGTYSTGQEVA